MPPGAAETDATASAAPAPPPPAEGGDAPQEGAEAGAGAAAEDDDDAERPASAFNPLLWKALQALGSAPPPIAPPTLEANKVEGGGGGGGAGSQAGSGTGTRQGTPMVMDGAPSQTQGVNGSAEKGGERKANGIRVGPTGKRKPKNAA